MSEKYDGGAAFPVIDPAIDAGMSLRDYFAAKAMAALIAATDMWCNDEDDSHVAEAAYQVADAMLKERQK